MVVLLSLWGAQVIGHSSDKTDRLEQETEITDPAGDVVVRTENSIQRHPYPGYLHVKGSYADFSAFAESVVEGYVQRADKEGRITEITSEFVDLHPPTLTPCLIHNIIYINMKRNPDRNQFLKTAIREMQFGHDVHVYRFEGICVPENGAKGCFLSHLHVLAWASRLHGNTLILEDDFQFSTTRKELLIHLNRADKVTHRRWDVMVLGQYVHEWQPLDLSPGPKVFRLLHCTTTSGYLVKDSYILDFLLKWHQDFLYRNNLKSFGDQDHCDQVQIAFQKVDLWLGFDKALGYQKEGQSIIGNVMAYNKWSCNRSYNIWYDYKNKPHHLKLHPPLTFKRIAVCFVATGKYKQFLPMVTQSCVRRMLKPHAMEFFVFTDSVDDIPSSYYGCPVSTYYIPWQGFPNDTLYRYHYMSKARKQLETLDHFYYMDVDYWVCNVPDPEELLQPGLIGTSHLHNLHPSDGPHKGSPETDPTSTACIGPDEPMQYYFGGGFQGGTSTDMLKAMDIMIQNIDTDKKNGIMAVWHDESHWNRYLTSHPPAIVLDQSYIYPEQCLDDMCEEANCINLRKANIMPKMIAINKDHTKIRSRV